MPLVSNAPGIGGYVQVKKVADWDEVYHANSPIAYTDLDLSSYIGAKKSIVLVQIFNNSGDATALAVYFRQNGDTTNQGGGGANTILSTELPDQYACYLVCATDENGVLEWTTSAAKDFYVHLIGYLQ